MNKLVIYSCIITISTFISSISQIILKISAQKEHTSKLQEYLNPMVIIAYGIFFGCTLLSMFALKVVPLSLSPILESSGYIFIAILSYIFLHEKLNRIQMIGMILILIGIAVYSL